MIRARRVDKPVFNCVFMVGAVICWDANFAIPSTFAQLTGGPYAIKPIDVNAGGTTSTGGPYSISASTGQSGGVETLVADPVPAPPLYQFDDGFWSTVLALPPSPPIEPTAPNDRQKNRYISFAPGNAGNTIAFRVDKITTPTGSCWVDTPGAMGNAKCVAAPVFRVWSEPVVHTGDCAIMPVASYEIRATTDAAVFTAPLVVNTIAEPVLNLKKWGDVVGVNNGVEWTPPNRFTNVNDVQAMLAYIQGFAIVPAFQSVNLEAISSADPCLNNFVNTADVLILVKAIAGDAYPFTTNPASCPVCP